MHFLPTAKSRDHLYRPDIDGLRAIATLAVVGFHALPSGIPGGFIGVDIFFVISGFLITSIILRCQGENKFSFLYFYARRIRRIFPALVIVLLACLVGGWLLFLPHDFVEVGKHVVAGATFVSNVLLLLDTSYFNDASAYRPLLHLWSLGVEEQFYLFWPILLLLTGGNRSRILWITAVVGLLSFVLNVLMAAAHPDAVFYLPFTRFWELMFGSALAALPNNAYQVAGTSMVLRNFASFFGVLLITVSIVVLTSAVVFPGWWALLPVFGTVCIIWGGPTAWLNRSILSWRPLVFVGLISYPLYLWHWPLLSFAAIIYGDQLSLSIRAITVTTSIVLAFLTYRFIELPIRHERSQRQLMRLAGGLVVSIGICGFAGLSVYTGMIKAAAASDRAITVISDAILKGTEPGVETIVIPGNVTGTALFIGDSFVAQYRPRFEKLGAEKPMLIFTAEFRTSGGCPPIEGIAIRSRKRCYSVMREAFERAMNSDVKTVVLGSDWTRLKTVDDFYFPDKNSTRAHELTPEERADVLDSFSKSISELRTAGKQVFVLLSTVGGEAFDPRRMVDRSRIIPVARYQDSVSLAEALQYSKPVVTEVSQAALKGGATVLNPSDWLCRYDRCPTVDSEHRPISGDGYHLRQDYVREYLSGADDLVRAYPLYERPDSTLVLR